MTNILIAIFETVMIHILFNKIFERQEKYEKLLVPAYLFVFVAVLVMEIMGKGVIMALLGCVTTMAYGYIFYKGNLYKKCFYTVMYLIMYMSGHMMIEFMNGINMDMASVNKLLGWSMASDVLFVKIIEFLMILFMIYVNEKNDSDEQYADTFKLFLIVPASTVLLLVAIYHSDIYEYGIGRSSGLFLVALLFMVISNVALQGMSEKYAAMKHKEYEGRARKIRSDMEQKFYKNVEKSNREYMELMHNIKQHFSVIGTMADGNRELEDYLASIDKKLKSVSKVIYSENNIFNAILSEKRDEAVEKGIVCDIRIDKNLGKVNISDVEMIEVVGNILDNAIEAVQKVENTDNRKIMIRGYMSRCGSFFIFDVKNYFKELPVNEGGKLISLKKDKERHGIGLESVKKIVEKNNGYVNIKIEENLFTITISLPIFPSE